MPSIPARASANIKVLQNVGKSIIGLSDKEETTTRFGSVQGREIPDLIEWSASLLGIWNSEHLQSDFNRFRLRKTSIIVFEVMMVIMVLILLLPLVDVLFHWNCYDFMPSIMVGFFASSLMSLLVLSLVKFHKLYLVQYPAKVPLSKKSQSCQMKSNRVSSVKSQKKLMRNGSSKSGHSNLNFERQEGSNLSNHQTSDCSDLEMAQTISAVDGLREQRTDQWEAIQSISVGELILENLTMWLIIFALQLYAIGQARSTIGAAHRVPMTAAMSSLVPFIFFMVLKRTSFRSTIACYIFLIVANTLAIGLFVDWIQSAQYVLYLTLSCFIYAEYLRHSWHSFLTTQRLAYILDENERLAEEIKSNELRHMIGNVAHDLKTPLTSFTSGMEVIRMEASDLQKCVRSSACQPTAIDQKLSTILEVADNVATTNTFMIMTINRCIDYNKTLFGLKLTPRCENFHLKSSLDFVVSCLKTTNDDVEIDVHYLGDQLKGGEVMMSSDKQWLLENLLCLIGNAVKFSGVDRYVNVDLILEPYDNPSENVLPRERAEMIRSGLDSQDYWSFHHRSPAIATQAPVMKFASKSSGLFTSFGGLPSFSMSSLSIPSTDLSGAGSASQLSGKLKSLGGLTAVSETKSSQNSMKNSRPIDCCPSSVSSLQLRFVVTDSGPGVDEEYHDKMFQEPAQAARLNGGTGLGLYSLARRVETLKGTFGVHARGDGASGCVFWFAIPFQPVVPRVASLQAQQEALEQSSPWLFPSIGIERLKRESLLQSNVASPRSPPLTERDPAANAGKESVPLVKAEVSVEPSRSLIQRIVSPQSNPTSPKSSSTPKTINSSRDWSFLTRLPFFGKSRVQPTEVSLSNSLNGHISIRFSAVPVMEHTISEYESSDKLESSTRKTSRRISNVNCSHIRRDSDNKGVDIEKGVVKATDSMNNNRCVSSLPIGDVVTPDMAQDLLKQQLRVLVVDDAVPIVKMTALVLKKQGYDVLTANNGARALEIFQEQLAKSLENGDNASLQNRAKGFDVVLMDFQMPVMDGVTAIKEWRAIEHRLHSVVTTAPAMPTPQRETIIIGFSAKSDEDDINQAFLNGMDAFLPKPFTLTAFNSIIGNIQNASLLDLS